MSDRTAFFDFARTHDDRALDLVRMFLGIALFIRGILFVADSSAVIAVARSGGGDYLLPALLLHVATLAHLLGGLTLAFGLLTRVAAIIQLPVLAGAVYLAAQQSGLLMIDQSLELSVLVLFLLAIFAAFGSGRWSLDWVLFARGITPESLARTEANIEKHRSDSRAWDEARLERVAVQNEALSPGAVVEQGSRLREPPALVKYGLLSVVAVVLVVLGVSNLPSSISSTELTAIGGVVLVILSLFLLLYRTAFSEE